MTQEINEKLLDEASKKLGMSSEKILEAAKSGDIQSILSNLDKENADKIKSLLGDKSAVEKFMNSPQVQDFLKNFLGKK